MQRAPAGQSTLLAHTVQTCPKAKAATPEEFVDRAEVQACKLIKDVPRAVAPQINRVNPTTIVISIKL